MMMVTVAMIVLVQVMSPIQSVGQSVCLSVQCIVEKRLIGSGCCLGLWVGWVRG